MDERRSYYSLQLDRWRMLDEEEILRRKQLQEGDVVEPSITDMARMLVVEWWRDRDSDPNTMVSETLNFEDTYAVWSCKTLQNWKCLVSTTLPDARYYEVTHDGDKGQTYLDVYTKVVNVVIPDEQGERFIAAGGG